MAESSKKLNINSLNSPIEPFPGLSIDDLNKYLPAIQTVEDMSMEDKKIKEGMFLTRCIDGFKKLPDESIDLIIARPPEDNWETTLDSGQGNTLQDYYKWNQTWLEESIRVLKNTGAIYIFCPWQYSGMYHGLLSNFFNVQTRITWKNNNLSTGKNIWGNQASDIWFATKTDEFLFNQNPVGVNTIATKVSKNNKSERSKTLHNLSNKKRYAFYNKFLNQKRKVLYEGIKNGKVIGHTDNYVRVEVEPNVQLINSVQRTRLLNNLGDSLFGRI